MKAPFSPLARRLFADPIARPQLDAFLQNSCGLGSENAVGFITDAQGVRYTIRSETVLSLSKLAGQK